MKKNSDELSLLDAVLADESWESCHARLRSEGLATLRAAKLSRSRRIFRAQISALLLVFAAAWWNLSPHAPISSSNQAQAGDSSPSFRSLSESQHPASTLASSPDTAPYITEEQMLALFPKGSCVLAEVNGQTELVFFDTTKAREGFQPPRSSN